MHLYILNEYRSGQKNGIGTYLGELIPELKKTGMDICLVEFNSPEKHFSIVEEESGISRMSFPPFPNAGIMEHAWVISTFFRLYIENSEEVVFLLNHTPCDDLMKAIRKSHPLAKILFTIHDLSWTTFFYGDDVDLRKFLQESKENSREFSDDEKSMFKTFQKEQTMFDLADRIITLSSDTLRVLTNVYAVPEEKIAWIPNGRKDTFVEITKEQKQCWKQEHYITEEILFLFAGRVTELKGAYALIKAFEKVLAVYPDCRLIFAGEVYATTELFHIARNYTSKITFTGHISRAEMEEWYQVVDVGVLPSYTEQCSYTGLEMMSWGLPVVFSDGFGVRTMFCEGENGKVAPIGNRKQVDSFIHNLTTAMINLAKQPELRLQLSKKGRQVYKKNYQSKQMIQAYKDLFFYLK